MSLKFTDKRGTLFFPVKDNFISKQTTVSCNKKNVFRGIHINDFEKVVTCVQGKILDIIINFDESANDYLKPQYFTLDPTTDQFQILVPKNYGHAFLSLEENSIVIYNLSGEFNQETTKFINYLDPYINITLPVKNNDLIISDKDNEKTFTKPIDYLIFGHKGFIGQNMINILKKYSKNFITTNLRLHELEEIRRLINTYKPKYIINCAGITGTPNIFWCDEHKVETVETNIIYQMTLASICKENNIHLTIFGSAGIFNDDKLYSEEEKGNNCSNFYGECRILLEQISNVYDNILYLRVNYPISSLKSNKNLITKLLSYTEINDCEISITYLDNLLPLLINIIENNETGICNFTNPGTINLTDIIYEIENYTNNKLNKIINLNKNINKRTCVKLETNKINKYNPLSIHDATKECIISYYSNNIT